MLENNVVYRCKSAGFHQHYGRDNMVRNNIFAFNRQHELMRTRNEDHNSFFFTNNIVCFDSGDLLGSNWQNDHYVMDEICSGTPGQVFKRTTFGLQGRVWSNGVSGDMTFTRSSPILDSSRLTDLIFG